VIIGTHPVHLEYFCWLYYY